MNVSYELNTKEIGIMADLYTAASVDFNQVVGKLNHKLHASNSGPALSTRSLIQFDDEFKKMNFYSSRTHDWALWNQGQRMVDTHFVFPLYHLDPSDPKNYYFKPTDDIIKLVHNCNMHVFYRLGTSIEHSARGARSAENHYNTICCQKEIFLTAVFPWHYPFGKGQKSHH